MAVALEGFSIREYASKTRTMDVGKCWPFCDNEARTEVVEAFLPPIKVKKFNWWWHEVELARSQQGESSSKASQNESTNSESREGEDEAIELVVKAEVLGSTGGKSEFICPLCRTFQAATVKTMNAHVGSCIARAAREDKKELKIKAKGKAKAKAKAPKKRSIVEIFAIAPQVDRINEDDDYEEEDDDDDHNSDRAHVSHRKKVSALVDILRDIKRKKKKKETKLKDETLTIMTKLKKQKKVTKFKNKDKKKKCGGKDLLVQSIAKKEKSCNLKLHSLFNFTEIGDKGLRKDILDAASIPSKKRRLERLATEKKTKTFTTSKLIAKHQKLEIPVRGILKNHTKAVWEKTFNLLDATQLNQCDTQLSHRHVRFSGQDDILGPRRKPFPSVEFPELQHLCSSNSDSIAASLVTERSAKRGKNLAIVDKNGSWKDASLGIENEREFPPLTEKQLPVIGHSVDFPNFPWSHVSCEEHLLDKSQGYRTTSHDPIYASTPRFVSMENDGYLSNVITQVGGNMSRACNGGRVIDQSVDPRPRLAALCSTNHVKAFPQPSLANFTDLYGNKSGKLPFPSKTTADNYSGHALQYRPFCHMSPKELMPSLSSFPDWKQVTAMCTENCTDEDFVGLPLNSQGELIQPNSNGKRGYQLMRPSTTGSSMSFTVNNNVESSSMGDHLSFKNCVGGVPRKGPLNLFPVLDSVKGNTDVPVASRIGNPELQGAGRTKVDFLKFVRRNVHSVYPLESELDMMCISPHGHKQYNHVQRGPGNGKVQPPRDCTMLHVTQPTMRLMGKEFTVGRGNKDLRSIEDVNLWTNKKIIKDYCPANTSIGNSPMKTQNQQDSIVHPSSERLKESIVSSSESQANQISPSALLIKPTESRSSLPYINYTTDAMYQNGCGNISVNPIPELDSCCPPDVCLALYNQASIFQEPLTCGYEILKSDSGIPKLPSSPHKTSQHMSSKSGQPKNKMKLPQHTKSSFRFPFLHSDSREHFRPSWCQKSMLSWTSDTTQHKGTMIGCPQSYSDTGFNHHPFTMSGDNFHTNPTVYGSPERFYPFNPLPFHSPLQNSLASVSFAHPPVVPVCPDFTPLSALKYRNGNKLKFNDQKKPRVIVKGPDQGKNTKTKPAAVSEECKKLTKKPMMVFQEVSSCVVKPLKVGDGLEGNVQFSTAFEQDVAKDKSSNMACVQNCTQNKGNGSLSEIDPLRLGSNTRSGLIKLTAGTKHILKCSHIDQNNSSPSQPSIPFREATGSGRVLDSDGKSAMIYRF